MWLLATIVKIVLKKLKNFQIKIHEFKTKHGVVESREFEGPLD